MGEGSRERRGVPTRVGVMSREVGQAVAGGDGAGRWGPRQEAGRENTHPQMDP